MKAGARWCMMGWAIANWVSGATGVGPGVMSSLFIDCSTPLFLEVKVQRKF
jgi:hypothetical protein